MEEIRCPFCDNNIEKNVETCPHCGSLFKEPELKGIKFKEFRVFLAIDILTFGFFSSLWFFINHKALNSFTTKEKDTIKLNWLIVLLFLSLFMYICYIDTNILLSIVFASAQYILLAGLTYRVLKIIQRYTLKKYNVSLDFNPYYIVFFTVLYLVHFIDTYTDRVTNVHEYFDFKSPQGIALIILLIILAIFINTLPYIHSHLPF